MKQTKALQKEKIFVTPAAMKDRFKKLVDALRKHPHEAGDALKKLFPDGLKMLAPIDTSPFLLAPPSSASPVFVR